MLPTKENAQEAIEKFKVISDCFSTLPHLPKLDFKFILEFLERCKGRLPYEETFRRQAERDAMKRKQKSRNKKLGVR